MRAVVQFLRQSAEPCAAPPTSPFMALLVDPWAVKAHARFPRCSSVCGCASKALNIQAITWKMLSNVQRPWQPHWHKTRLLKPQIQYLCLHGPDSTVNNKRYRESLLVNTAESPQRPMATKDPKLDPPTPTSRPQSPRFSLKPCCRYDHFQHLVDGVEAHFG